MEFTTLHDKIEQTVKSGKPNNKMYFDLLGTEILRHRDGNRTKIETGSVVLIPAKTYYDIKNTGDSVLAVLGNRAEAFGGPTIYLL